MKISVIHASFGRPAMARQTHLHWRHAAGGHCEIEWLLSIDEADPSYNEYKTLCNDFVNGHGIIVSNQTNTSVAAINNAARICTGDIIMVISDDFAPIPDWDGEILKATKGKTDWILKTQDGTQGWIVTLPIMDRIYYERFWYVYHPAYTHMFCDTELSAVADYLGRKIISPLEFTHKHYSVKGGIPKDATSIKADATWNTGEQVFLERYKNDFFIPSAIKPIKDQGTVNWINQKLKSQHGNR